MAITVQANPVNLTWGHFTVVPNQITDPADGSLVDAYTTFNFNIPSLPPRTVDGKQAFADPMTITITPNCQVWSGVAQTAALLSHEQWHYDIGTVTGRALARELSRARKKTVAELITVLQNAVQLHFRTRAGLLQKRYDIDTRHGTNSHYQGVWKSRMTTCLGNPNADQLGGFYL
ncbi:MAG: hypothetical protein R2747_24950 [Pyrinomonadaceae bacterium]